MAQIRITIDGETVMDSDCGTWTSTPPELVATHMQQPKPWSRPLLMVVADAAMRDQPTTITITTGPKTWTLTATEQ